MLSFEPKNEQNYFLIPALASKMGQMKKIKALYYINQGVSFGQKSINDFVRFLVQMRTRKFAFEIYRPLASSIMPVGSWTTMSTLGNWEMIILNLIYRYFCQNCQIATSQTSPSLSPSILYFLVYLSMLCTIRYYTQISNL